MATDTNLPEELKVFISNRESTCGECEENLMKGYERREARGLVRGKIEQHLEQWES